jgi:hypothetical protein
VLSPFDGSTRLALYELFPAIGFQIVSERTSVKIYRFLNIGRILMHCNIAQAPAKAIFIEPANHAFCACKGPSRKRILTLNFDQAIWGSFQSVLSRSAEFQFES